MHEELKIQLDESMLTSHRYIRAVQLTTLQRVPNLILGFLGYTSRTYCLDTSSISLQRYAEPKCIARFIGYLQARGVGFGHMASHLSLSRKINDFLQSGAEEGSTVRIHARKMEEWLSKLEAQLSAALPARPKAESVDVTLTWKWVEKLAKSALLDVDQEMGTSGCLTRRTSLKVQQALIASLITGCYCPPFRIGVLVSLLHPTYNGEDACQDANCAGHDRGDKCMGNHLELVESTDAEAEEKASDSWNHFDYKTTSIRNVIIHHKTDRG